MASAEGLSQKRDQGQGLPREGAESGGHPT